MSCQVARCTRVCVSRSHARGGVGADRSRSNGTPCGLKQEEEGEHLFTLKNSLLFGVLRLIGDERFDLRRGVVLCLFFKGSGCTSDRQA